MGERNGYGSYRTYPYRNYKEWIGWEWKNGMKSGLESHLVQREQFKKGNEGKKQHSVFWNFKWSSIAIWGSTGK